MNYAKDRREAVFSEFLTEGRGGGINEMTKWNDKSACLCKRFCGFMCVFGNMRRKVRRG